MQNVPDDWNSYWCKCSACGRRYHASDGGCECEEYEECEDDNSGEENDESSQDNDGHL
jgi:hypothetical protein